MTQTQNRDHLFISYAVEDRDFAEWLSLKLIAAGYAVWRDNLKMLGGEPYPQVIDDAIKNRTFKLLALLSKNSISKDNPVKERTLALNLSKERKEQDFVIPLNIDGLKPTEIDWMQNNLNYISFHRNWAEGLNQLLKKLESAKTPKAVTNGESIVAQIVSKNENVQQKPENIHSNILEVKKLPDKLKLFKIEKRFNYAERSRVDDSWAYWWLGNYEVLSFHSPPASLSDLSIALKKTIDWKNEQNIQGVNTANVIKNLIAKSILVMLTQKGLTKLEQEIKGKKRTQHYFPKQFNQDGKLHFVDFKGRKNWLNVHGRRKATTYHLSPVFTVRDDITGSLFIQIKVRLVLFKEDGTRITGFSALRKRKTICKDWWNDNWLKRHLAIAQEFSTGKDEIKIGANDDESIIVSSKFLQMSAPVSIPAHVDDKTINPEELAEAEKEDE